MDIHEYKLNIDIDYFYRINNNILGYSNNCISLIDSDFKVLDISSYAYSGRPYIYLDKKYLVESFYDDEKCNSTYWIKNLDGLRLSDVDNFKIAKYIITLNDVRLLFTIINNIIYISNIDCDVIYEIRLDSNVEWYSNPVVYNNDSILILVKIDNTYHYLDIKHMSMVMLSTNFLIDYSEKNTQITIGYFNNKVDIFLPKSNGGVYLLNPKNIRFTEIGSVLVKKTKEINTRLYKTFKRTDDFTEILKDLKGVKSIVYDINIENWIKLNKSIIKDGGYNVIENTFALENTLERKLPISRQLTQGNSCKSDNYYDYLLFIIDYLSNSNNYEYIYLYRNVDYPVNYVYEITPTYRIYAYLRNVNMFDISGIYGDAITGEYYFTEYKGYCQDGSIQYRYFPVRIDAINPPVVLPDIGTEYVDYSESINKTIVDNIVALFTKLDIITQIMNFTRNPFYKIRTDTLTNLGLNYFQQIKEHLDYDKSLIDYMFLYWTTLLKPTFISSDIVVS